jgi:hypothetical protein
MDPRSLRKKWNKGRNKQEVHTVEEIPINTPNSSTNLDLGSNRCPYHVSRNNIEQLTEPILDSSHLLEA